ncbi:MAG: ribosome assembly cofactor RimP [Rikenellaceae bacterium]
MIDKLKIVEIAQAKIAEGLGDGALYVVECSCSGANEVELLVDSDTKVSIDDCITLSRAVEAEFDRDVEDFSLTVASAGIGSELKLLRQFTRLIGRSVEVLLKSGIKVVGELTEATEEAIKVKFERRETTETSSGKRKKVTVEVEERYTFGEIKSVKEYLDFS